MDYSQSDLEYWDSKICDLADEFGLDYYPVDYEIVDYYSMIGTMAYHGLPTHYDHWSFGKSFERTHQMYNEGMEGLPFELIINSDPSIAYLMRDNPLYLQVLIMAHCLGHSDFFKKNRMFAHTKPETVIQRFRGAKKRIQSYMEDPHIGIDQVEKVLDACHAIQFQMSKSGRVRKTRQEQIEEYTSLINEDKTGRYKKIDLSKNPIEPDYDLLAFISENARLPSWKKDIIDICIDEGQYFIPQMQTKVINEGWACVTGDTLIDTDEGLVTAKELVEKRKGRVFDGEKYQNLVDWHYNPSTERIKITTNRGYVIHGSVKHRIWNGSEWKYLTQLKIDDEIPISVGNSVWNQNYYKINPVLKQKRSANDLAKEFNVSTAQIRRHRAGIKTEADLNVLNKISQIMNQESNFSNLYLKSDKKIKFPEIMCERLANTLGMIIGDGGFWAVKNSNRIKSIFTTGDDELKDLFASHIKYLFDRDCRVKWDDTKWRVEIPSDIIVKWFVKTFNLHVGNTAKIKFIPDEIMKSPKSVVASFLRGLYDTDGCASKGGSNVIYVTTSITLAKQIHELLLKFGIISSLNTVKSNNVNHNDCHRISITGQSVKIFKDEIGFNLKRKQSRLNDFINNKKWFSKVKNVVKITNIEYDTGEVYDFTVENSHRYKASCFINHNSFNHYKLTHNLWLPDELHLPILKVHNQVVRPHIGSINPYHLGFYLFQKIEERFGLQECFIAREACNDISFIRQYLEEKDCFELNLFSYGKRLNGDVIIDQISDNAGWEEVKQLLLQQIGGSSIPVIKVTEIRKDGALIIDHEHTGKDLDMTYAKKVVGHIKDLWGSEVKLNCKISHNSYEI
jgi:stage V sporulation protein R